MESYVPGISPIDSFGAGMIPYRSTEPATDFTKIFISELLKQYFKSQSNSLSSDLSGQMKIFNEILINQLALNLAKEDAFGFKSFIEDRISKSQTNLMMENRWW